ncbi:hypothetical protein [Anatilimnocola floriformis]|uniref:hypothetical protein n=1 Tax=Anatilimnocola floriformis TaxID=2948575 RepID=UPI0020C2CA69|nr:hypothetical protein [Anatilimnocola floriformis]
MNRAEADVVAVEASVHRVVQFDANNFICLTVDPVEQYRHLHLRSATAGTEAQRALSRCEVLIFRRLAGCADLLHAPLHRSASVVGVGEGDIERELGRLAWQCRLIGSEARNREGIRVAIKNGALFQAL